MNVFSERLLKSSPWPFAPAAGIGRLDCGVQSLAHLLYLYSAVRMKEGLRR